MNDDAPDDDLTPWAVPLDEPAEVPVAVTSTPPPRAIQEPESEPPRLSMLSREVPTIEFQPRLRVDR